MSNQSEEKILTVSEINRIVKEIIEDSIPPVWVTGEISNYKAHVSGHIYFSLKDENAQISCIMFKSYAKNISGNIGNGVKVRVFGEIGVYEKVGVYQIYVKEIREEGKGDLQIAFEKMKRKLFEEGLFAEQHKLPIPEYPMRIGVITAIQAAALRDIINVLSRRASFVEIVLKPAQVQGEQAKFDIVKAIEELNEYGKVDVIILTRGGGSIEDLWAFNEEIVARAVYDSKIPIITGVGHEIDFTIVDFVSDLRAPTPSAAAEVVIRSRQEIESDLLSYERAISRVFIRALNDYNGKLNIYGESYALRKSIDIVRQRRIDLDRYVERVNDSLLRILSNRVRELSFFSKRVESTNYKNILKRGFVIARRDGNIIKSRKDVNLYDRLIFEFYDGKIRGIVDKKIKE
ncbi:MAG: exodeoxyribonuclease VII large subunit [Proteobacteria bacterium]|nr:exodeoxyribonuclease VII large subunit [Pseudomonadota bacterium]